MQTGLGFSSTKSTKSTRSAERKSKQVRKLLKLLHSKQKSFDETLKSLAYLVGEPVCRGKKERRKRTMFQHLVHRAVHHQLITECLWMDI